ncbi:putative extracellular serine-rich [Phaeomoniella chlamydospora]|uniref:Putative extracellular serine-rich n=1 Tax=Phaeomoniella chlamydospora TaxID=158046 RepID=A0A0G2GDG4_PHACM|nr:putative extracellular serine-rich [Phaeomoniella chlamydospora]
MGLNGYEGGNFGGIIVVFAVSYDYSGSYNSALTTEQWNQLYAYQLAYGVRMVQYDVYPGLDYGSTALGGCCDSTVEQLVSLTDITNFTQSGLKTGAGVLNNFNGRQQMVFFMPFAQDWSPTSAVLQHAYITWMTRGLYAGYRRVNLNTQIDDMFLETNIYTNSSESYRVTPSDMKAVASWVTTVNAKMPSGSSYYPEIGHNGNGNIIEAEEQSGGENKCPPGSIQYDEVPTTALEFQKTLGTGSNFWPTTPTTYGYKSTCVKLDSLEQWFASSSNRDKFMHITHTFTHLELNNATYSDALKEIQFNQAWLSQVGLASGKFTSNGMIPPAITGFHNGDVIRAWHDAGLTNCVNPRWATRIYYNCDSSDCTTQEWIDTSAGTGSFSDLLALEKAGTTRHLFDLYHDPYMFHQANLRNTGIGATTINGVTSQISIFQAWVETVVQEFVRLANWPIITLKQADFTTTFAARMARDACGYGMSYTVSKNKITGVTVTASGNTCSQPIPITFPGKITSTQGFKTEQVGNDPLTIWVKLTGSAVSFTLSTPISF